MPNYMNTHDDVGFYAISKDPKDKGKFATPSLRDLKYTAPSFVYSVGISPAPCVTTVAKLRRRRRESTPHRAWRSP